MGRNAAWLAMAAAVGFLAYSPPVANASDVKVGTSGTSEAFTLGNQSIPLNDGLLPGRLTSLPVPGAVSPLSSSTADVNFSGLGFNLDLNLGGPGSGSYDPTIAGSSGHTELPISANGDARMSVVNVPLSSPKSSINSLSGLTGPLRAYGSPIALLAIGGAVIGWLRRRQQAGPGMPARIGSA